MALRYSVHAESRFRFDLETAMKQAMKLLLVLAAFGLGPEGPVAQAAEIAVNLGKVSIDIGFGPPPQRHEPVPTPRLGHLWVPGYWQIVGHRHEWIAGRWVDARHGQVWVADHWTPAGHRWRYEPGHWGRHDSRHSGNTWQGGDGSTHSHHH